MRKTIVAMCLGVVLAPSPVYAWGFEAHRFVMDRAIALLPDALRPLFEKNRAMLVERSIDPDTWRAAGFTGEPPNHFLDLDWEGYGKYPFLDLPRDFSDAVEKFGMERVREMGMLPWRAEEFHGNLRRAFEQYSCNEYGSFDLLFFSATLGHYVGDAHVPFHAVWNYDGQRTGQHGIHSRYERDLFERYRDRLPIAPAPPKPIADMRAFIFDRLLEGTQLVPAIFEADLEAIGGRDTYDDAYFEAFFAATRDVMGRRLSESITAVAGAIVGAWDAAGRPPVPVEQRRAPQRRRRP
ncbi:MAG: hypothetical protein ACRD26_03020 [Vicinamibacterales bacterium]